MSNIVLFIIQTIIRLIIGILLVDAVMSFFVSPYHPVRVFLGKITNPMLAPIRKILPTAAGLDFSPMVLILLLYLVGTIIVNLFL